MKKIILLSILMVCCLTAAIAQSENGKKQAEIKFDKTTHTFGKFSDAWAKVTGEVTDTSGGEAPRIINQAGASGG